jgi:hypothetical protein
MGKIWQAIEEEFGDKVLGAHKIAKNAEDGVKALFKRIEALEAELEKKGIKVESDVVKATDAVDATIDKAESEVKAEVVAGADAVAADVKGE